MWMRAETQADRLESLLRSRNIYPHYRLGFIPFEVKKSTLKNLEVGDIFLVGIDQQELVLLDEEAICANVMLESESYVKIIDTEKALLETPAKKYHRVEVTLGTFQCRKLEEGYRIETNEIRFDRLDISVNRQTIATGALVKADGEIAVRIDKVTK
jgi:flagellar motor switch/type III secretory pathway protein FliN